MYNNIKKAYILNMYHAFLLIDRKSTLVLNKCKIIMIIKINNKINVHLRVGIVLVIMN